MAAGRSKRRSRPQRRALAAPSASRGELRKKKQKRRRKNNWLWKVILLMLICLGGYFFLHSGLFSLKTVEVVGNSRVSDEDVILLANLPMGENIFEVDRNTAAEKVALHSMVESAIVKTRPFHKILIQVEEKVAVAWMYHEDDGYYLVAENGSLLEKREEYNDYLPLISFDDLPDFLCVGMILDSQNALDALAASTVFADFLRNQPRELTVSSDGGIVLTVNGLELRLGSAEKLMKKRRLIEDLLDEIPAEDLPLVEYIDVSSPRKPVLGGYDIEEVARQRREQQLLEQQQQNQEKEQSSQDGETAQPEVPSAEENTGE